MTDTPNLDKLAALAPFRVHQQWEDQWFLGNDGTAILLDQALPALNEWADLRAYRERTAWQPIDTAPKDGTEILGFCAGLKMHGLMAYETWESAGIKQGMWATTDGGYQRNPTHWMPLPAGPAPKESKP